MSEALEKISIYKRQVLKDLYDQCTEGQQGKFNQIFKGIDRVPEEKIESAILICERTVAKNKKEHGA